jgi:thiamine pyrophosphokinase
VCCAKRRYLFVYQFHSAENQRFKMLSASMLTTSKEDDNENRHENADSDTDFDSDSRLITEHDDIKIKSSSSYSKSGYMNRNNGGFEESDAFVVDKQDGSLNFVYRSQFWIPVSDKVDDYVLVMLNSASYSVELLRTLWDSCGQRLCADGGANRLFDAFSDPLERARYIPNSIVGDLDSIRPEVKDYYSERGTSIELHYDQNLNDIEKTLLRCTYVRQVILLGGQGRFDHHMSAIQMLFKFREQFDHFVLIDQYSPTEGNLILLLNEGKHAIHVTEEMEGPTCGLLPIGGRVECVSTTGLEWDLNKAELMLGGLVSTSNRVREKRVTVETSHPILWTMELQL